jgi:hypothetical protein
VQQRHGRDKLAVVLLSVDPESFGHDQRYVDQARKILEQRQIDWPSVFLPGGWSDAGRIFNLSGYGLVLVDARGIVRGVNLRGDDLEKAVAQALDATKPPR